MLFIFRSQLWLSLTFSLLQSLNLDEQTMLAVIITIISYILCLWNGQMNSRYSIKRSLRTSLISTGLKEFLRSGNCVPMWSAYGWLQAKILSIFQAAFSALCCFSNSTLWGNHDPPRMLVFLLQHFCRCRQKIKHHGSTKRGSRMTELYSHSEFMWQLWDIGSVSSCLSIINHVFELFYDVLHSYRVRYCYQQHIN